MESVRVVATGPGGELPRVPGGDDRRQPRVATNTPCPHGCPPRAVGLVDHRPKSIVAQSDSMTRLDQIDREDVCR
jgi:hypothetical protein